MFALDITHNVFCVGLQSLQGRDVQPGGAAQVFSRTKMRVRGRGPGKRADPAGVAHTGSTALMPGKGTGDNKHINSV